MYKLIRRISSSFFTRPGRSLADADDTEPVQIGRKRRASEDEPDEGPSTPVKRRRADTEEAEETRSEEGSVDAPLKAENESEEVKDATKGVHDLELEAKEKPTEVSTDVTPEAAEAAAVPLTESPALKAAEDAQAEAISEVSAEPQVEVSVVNGIHEVPEPEEPQATETKEEVKEAQVAIDLDDEEIPGFPPAADFVAAKAAPSSSMPSVDQPSAAPVAATTADH